MIDVASEQLLTLPEASRHVPGRPSVATFWRWRTKGVKGRRLESIEIGGRVYTSVEALARFARSATRGDVPTVRTARQRERDIAAAHAELEADGI